MRRRSLLLLCLCAAGVTLLLPGCAARASKDIDTRASQTTSISGTGNSATSNQTNQTFNYDRLTTACIIGVWGFREIAPLIHSWSRKGRQ